MAMEYVVVLLPVAIALATAGFWPWAGAVLGGGLLAWMPVVRMGTVRGSWLRQHVPVRAFEWRAFIQATHPFGVILWSAAMAFSWLPVLPLFLIGAIVLLLCGAYEVCEPRGMLLATAQDPRELLHVKVWAAVRLTMITVTPVLLAATAFHPGWWWVHALFGLGMLTLVTYAVVLKYANYVPNERLSANGANLAVATVFAILPGLSLVPLIMLFTEWPKAQANLRSHFHDHHH